MDLDQQLVLFEDIKSAVIRKLQVDERVRAVWLGGSLGRGAADALSDIDLVVVADDGRVSDLIQDSARVISIAGRAVLIHEAPQNAPVGGTQLNVLYDTAPLPIYVDWSFWPSADERPTDVGVLVERDPSIPPGSDTFESMLAGMPRTSVSPKSDKEWDHFRVYMVPVLVKSAARGWFDSVDQILGYMQIREAAVRTLEDALAAAERVLDDYGSVESPEAIRCIRRYLSQAPSWTQSNR